MGHLVSTENEIELHDFAKKIGLKVDWYQRHGRHPHYDLTTIRALHRAEKAGAKEVTPFKLVKSAWWSRYKNAKENNC